ncbi:unnamed protein product [Lactuca virosa]|uniref:Uncharacterized protein n=1 Tax=Lactuca virosa TaxID=75947 RepID=A0AAU9NR12_9ASTR|nr:unnamed protein product [Lactuca virosa]
MALYSKKSPPKSDIDFSDEFEGESLTVKHYIIQIDKKQSRPRRFPQNFDSSTSKGYDVGRKIVIEKKEGRKCFNYGGTDHFSRECKSKKVDVNEDYEVKYKNLLKSLERNHIDVKLLVAEVKRWVDEEESYDEDEGKDKCLMSYTDVFVTIEGSNSLSSFEADLAKVAKDSKTMDWDSSSLYQVNKIFIYYNNKKCMFVNYLCQILTRKTLT